jgi:hypothetical protein
MDLNRLIQDLNAEKEKLERVIASIEEMQRAAGLAIPPGSGKRLGRKSMGPGRSKESRNGSRNLERARR